MTSCCCASRAVLDELPGPRCGLLPIEQVVKGDLVWTFDVQRRVWRWDGVVETFCREYAGEMVGVHMAGDVIESTGRHPYWVVRGEELDSRPVTDELGDDNQSQNHPGRWVEARHLRVGDLLWTNSAGEVLIEDLLTYDATTVFYNFHVVECRSYAVGVSQVLVHNASISANLDPISGHAKRIKIFP